KKAAGKESKKVKPPAKPAAKAPKKQPDAMAEPASAPGISVGDAVPAFALPDQHGKTISSESLAGKPYVLYFYPKDDTPGCTREACAFRDDFGKFGALGATVIGVSPDGEKSHAKFAEKYGLPFSLLADTDKTLARAFGVWVLKQNYGREYMGIERSTFVVGSDGKVKRVFRRVKVDGHSDAVLESV
ncbi:MAG TPA: thioredoxin-dependent thiol peroxidase, partial [Polyangiaceae bacterium]|nr:thioredoxin-dependent thiol peroxidase [Polyangiaceae bacterium]